MLPSTTLTMRLIYHGLLGSRFSTEAQLYLTDFLLEPAWIDIIELCDTHVL